MNFTKGQWALALLSGIGAGCFPVLASALGLGDIQVDSRLNQPLRARIEVVGVTEEEWRQVRANIRTQGLSGEDAAHPELLESLTLLPVEDANHKRFIQVKSGSVLTEPLFDLPVEVSGQAAHVVRNYSVLLDPEVTTGPQGAVVAEVGAAVGSAGGARQTAKAAVATTQRVAGPAHKLARHAQNARHARTRTHAAAPIAGAAGSVAAAAQSSPPAVASDSFSAKQQLDQHIAILQQTLIQMQTTIAAQDAQIAKLTRKMTAASVAPAPAAGAREAEDSASTLTSTSTEEAAPTSFWLRPEFFYRLAAGLCLAALLAALTLTIMRKRKANAAPGATSVSFRDMPFDAEAFAARQQAVAQVATQERSNATPGQRTPTRVDRNTNYHVEETVDIEPVESAQSNVEADGMESWRTQTALLEQDILSATDALPYVKDTTNQVKPAIREEELALSEEQTLELQEAMHAQGLLEGQHALKAHQAVEARRAAAAPTLDEQQTLEIRPTFEMSTPARPAVHDDVVKKLENTLDVEPERVDVQLQLLEIYHHEALGNRDNFHSLLSKLKLDPGSLSPAQRSHLEMLRRTLEDGKLDDDAFIAQATG